MLHNPYFWIGVVMIYLVTATIIAALIQRFLPGFAETHLECKETGFVVFCIFLWVPLLIALFLIGVYRLVRQGEAA